MLIDLTTTRAAGRTARRDLPLRYEITQAGRAAEYRTLPNRVLPLR